MDILHRFFENQVDQHPYNIALICDDVVIGYKELEIRANQWAHLLSSRGVKRGDLVGLLLDRTVDLYSALLGILKIGAAYVPIDPDYPSERVKYILLDSQVKTLITADRFRHLFTDFQAPHPLDMMFAEHMQEFLLPQSTDRPMIDVTADDTCYVMYTSGSTGRPKGVEVMHRSISNYASVMPAIYGVTNQDRIYQGFSIAFDGSVEEIWLALSTGAALVVGTSYFVHAGAGLVEFLNRYNVTVFSTVPTLLSTLEATLPHLRILILGGEACPQEMINRWHRPDLHIFNTYGPTETTVIATYSECRFNKAITIGKPIPGCEIAIVDAELKPVQLGEVGELCIGGRCLARGYVNNPELTETKFIHPPSLSSTRFYRTGDLVCMTEDEQIHFVGRMDNQIKLRGFRIELAEIEGTIIKFPSVMSATVVAQELEPGVPYLVAYLLTKNSDPVDVDQLRTFLHNYLPNYMVPDLFESVKKFPLLASGKVDRAQLLKPHIQHKTHEHYVAPETDLEKAITTAWEQLLKTSPISMNDDFFHDLAGHSLLAAKTVSLLRKNSGMEHLSVLDLYENPTVRKLAQKVTDEIEQNAQHLTLMEGNAANYQDTNTRQRWRYRFCGLGQLAGCYLQYAISSWQFLFIFIALTYVMNTYSLFSIHFIASVIGLIAVLPMAMLTIVITSKWVLLGRVKPGHYPLWGWFYFRWWLVQRLQKMAYLDFIAGTPLFNTYCRLMGAKIGNHCYIGTKHVNTYDLIQIDDDTSIGYDAYLGGYVAENGWLKLGTISLGKGCFVGSRAIININCSMQDDAMLEDLSVLPSGHDIPSGQYFVGSPARQQTHVTTYPSKMLAGQRAGIFKRFKFSLLHSAVLLFSSLVYYTTIIPSILLICYYYNQHEMFDTLVYAVPASAVLFVFLYHTVLIGLKHAILPNLKPGKYDVMSMTFMRYQIIQNLINTPMMSVLADSLYFPFILRQLKGKIGKRVEIGELPHVVPEMITMDDESFAASMVQAGAPRIQHGVALFAQTVMGKRAFAGNFALLPAGTKLGENTLIGCLSVPPVNGEAEKPNTSWLGSPALILPRREVFTGFSENETFNPTPLLYAQRLTIEFIRIMLPFAFLFTSLVGFLFAADIMLAKLPLMKTLLLFPFVEAGIFFALGGVFILLKWLLMGRMAESIKPVWSVFIWKYDIIVHVYQEFIDAAILTPLMGTPFLAPFYRLLGMKIGKRVFIDTSDFTEFDLIDIGDDVTLNSESVIQTHLFEDRIFKMGRIKIGDGCNVGAYSIVLYNTVMEKNSSLDSLSLLMKGETLPANTSWLGIPVQPLKKRVLSYSAETTG